MTHRAFTVLMLLVMLALFVLLWQANGCSTTNPC